VTRPIQQRSSYPKQQVQSRLKVARTMPRSTKPPSFTPGRPSQSPLPPARPLTYADVRSDRIDVFAQRALLRMSKNPTTSADAAGMADAVKTGKLGGIYKEDEKVPALRARKMNSSWWLIIPKGEDAVLFLDPEKQKTGTPIIVFRDSIRSNPARLDPALQKVWQTYLRWRSGYIAQCQCSLPSINHQSLRQPTSSCGKPINNIVPMGYCENSKMVGISKSRCGVPQWIRNQAASLQERLDLETFDSQVNPILCLFLNENSNSGKFFKNQAERWAQKSGAFQVSLECSQSVGATSYKSGLDILEALNAASTCLNKRIKQVHIFGHSFSGGIIGEDNKSNQGLYVDGYTDVDGPVNEKKGGRTISDVPTNSLAQDVIFILHGCNTGRGCNTSNFAYKLFDHLRRSLDNPRVYGHTMSVCAGQDCSWCEYSKEFPTGKERSLICDLYRGVGNCGKENRCITTGMTCSSN
jgi:hypothetical protein